MTRKFKIAVLPGDGIGKEVMPEGLRVLEAASRLFDFELELEHIEWASCDYYAQTGAMMPEDWKARLAGKDAIYYGAVGWPATVPDHVSLWGSLLKFRREFDQYINLRPVRLFEGVPCPLVDPQGKPRRPGDIDFYVVRENTEGEYTNLGGVMYADTEREIVIQESVYSRFGTDRVLKFAFNLAQSRPRKHLTVATKSNGIAISMLGGMGVPTKSARATRESPLTSSTSTSSVHASCCSRSASTWSWQATCSATSSPTWGPPAPARLAWRPRPTSIPNERSHRCSNRCMVRPRTSTGKTSRTHWR